MNFDDALKHHLPRVWFRFKFIKYKYLGRGEPELHLVRHLVEPGTTAIDAGASIGLFAAEMAKAASYDCFFLSRSALRPVADFDPARDQDVNGRECIVNFIFIPAERRERVRALLAP